ncbi:hypothetical protein [Enterobacter roggenkampii]|uniref:hypothetical protein n=1 Tax=Enterobacter roggenkampii TaxID=1812935 RepID=UPI00200385C8|nr:hypothetical protein [Enterobacter roggenkampii]MCK7048843.1 hypothetical protein [Enterobacter roggenkampii]
MPLYELNDARAKRQNSGSSGKDTGYNSFNDGGDGGGSDMLQRIKTLEDKVATMATDIAVIKSNYATSANVESVKTDIANAKADLHSAMRLQALAIIGSVIAAVGTGVGLIIKMMPSLPH